MQRDDVGPSEQIVQLHFFDAKLRSAIAVVLTLALLPLAPANQAPIDTPSLTDTVLNSIGVPPAARMPSLTCSASRRWL